MFPYKPTILGGTPICGNPHMMSSCGYGSLFSQVGDLPHRRSTQEGVFLDACCIHQTNLRKKADGIRSMSGILWLGHHLVEKFPLENWLCVLFNVVRWEYVNYYGIVVDGYGNGPPSCVCWFISPCNCRCFRCIDHKS